MNPDAHREGEAVLILKGTSIVRRGSVLRRFARVGCGGGLLRFDRKEIALSFETAAMVDNDVGTHRSPGRISFGVLARTLPVVLSVHIPARKLLLQVHGQPMRDRPLSRAILKQRGVASVQHGQGLKKALFELTAFHGIPQPPMRR